MNWMFIYYACLISMLSVTKVYGQCSGSALCIDLTTTYTGSITSPGYDSGGYPGNQNCSWHIEGFPSTGLMFYLARDTVDCSDGVYIYDGQDDSGQLLNPITCGSGLSSIFVRNGSIFVHFISDSTNQGRGFNLIFTSAEESVGTACSDGQNLTASSTKQFITSRNFPDETGNDNCTWYIKNENNNNNIQLEVLFMHLDEFPYGYLDILDGQDNLITRFEKFNPPDIQKRTFLKDGFRIYLQTNSETKRHGVLMSFVTVETVTDCTYPVIWQTNKMNDSIQGEVTFTNISMNNWSEKSFGEAYNEWTCYQKIGSLIISRSVKRDIENSNTFEETYSYLCMQIESQSNGVYNYKLLSAKQSNSDNARLILISNSITPNFPSACNEEFHNEIRTLTIIEEETTTQVIETTTTTSETTSSIPPTTTLQTLSTTQQQPTTSILNSTTTEMSTSTQETQTTASSTEDCTYPVIWQTNKMNDSVQGEVTFTNISMINWSEKSFGEAYNEWTCYQKIGSLIISRSVKGDIENSNTFEETYSYLCMQIESESNGVYNYKLLSAKQSNSDNARLILIQNSITPNFPSACNEEFHNEIRTLTIIEEDTTTQVIETTTTTQETTSSIPPTTTSQTLSTTQQQVTTSILNSTTTQMSTSTQETPTTASSTEEVTTTQQSPETTTAEETTTQPITTTQQQLTTSVSVMTTSTQEPSTSTTTTTVTTTQEDTATDSTTAHETTSDLSTTLAQETTSDMSTTIAQETTSDISTTTAQETTSDISTTTAQETTSDISTTTAQETTSDVSTTTTQETTSDLSTATAQKATYDISTTTGVTTSISDISTTAGQTTTDVATTFSTQATTTTQNQSTPSIIDSTSTQETQSSATTTASIITTTQEVSTLSSAAQIAVIAGTVGGVAVLFLLAALVIVIIFSCCRKPRHRRLSSGPSSGPDDRQPDSQDESVPSWVHMVDNLYQNGYSPYFYNDFKSGKFSGESLDRV